jgi:hypothetical protein
MSAATTQEASMPIYKVEYSYAKDALPQVMDWAGKIKLPSSVSVLSKYSYAAEHAGFVIVECADHAEIAELAKPYRHILNFRITPLNPLK